MRKSIMEQSKEMIEAADKMAKETIAENNKALKEIGRLNALIEATKEKQKAMFKDLGITKEIQEQDIAVSDLPSGERKIYDLLQRELLAELHAKGIDLQAQTIKKKAIGLTMARKRIKI